MSAGLLDRVRSRLALEPGLPTQADVAAVVRQESGGLLGDDDVLRAVRDAVDELAGAGPLEPLLRLTGVTVRLSPPRMFSTQTRSSRVATCASESIPRK